MSQLMNRDPFAREELHREKVQVTAKTCTWCGCVKRLRTSPNRPFLYRYWIEADRVMQSRNYINGMYCSQSCFHAYND